MHEARSLPTHTTISPLTCPLRTSSSIHTHRSTTHTTERFGRGAEETMSEGTPQPLGTIKSEKRVNPQISRRECNRYGQGEQHRANEIVHQHDQSLEWLASRGHELPPPTGHGQARTCRAMHKPLQRNLARYRELGNGVIGSTAQAFPRPSADHCPGNSISFVTRSPTDSINPKFSDRPPLGTVDRGSKATLPLTIPRRVFKSSAKDSTRRSVEITLQGGTHDLSDARATPTTRALGGQRPLLRVGNRATSACVAPSPDSDLEAFSHNPAHGSFAPLAFQPSAMTNCANQRFLSY
ncbi:hypothetical protein V6N13_056320 [Hibiscus sabdariffa]